MKIKLTSGGRSVKVTMNSKEAKLLRRAVPHLQQIIATEIPDEEAPDEVSFGFSVTSATELAAEESE